MESVTINYLAVLAAVAFNFILGGLWYSKFMFANKWLEAMNPTEEELAAMTAGAGKAMGYSFISASLMSFILAYVVALVGAKTFFRGAETGFWLWLGFVAMTHITTVLFENRKWTLYFISMGYYFVSLLVMGGILAVW